MSPARRQAVTLLAAIALLSAPCTKSGSETRTPVGSTSATAKAAAYTKALDSTATDLHLPGAIAGVWVPDGPPWVGSFGVANTDTNDPLVEADRFPIRSVTKSFTVTLLLMLVRDGKVSLTDPISKYVKDVPNGGDVTLADLAAMTSGLVDYSKNETFIKEFTADFARQWTVRQLIDFGLAEEPLFAPGTGYNYSNTNTLLIGEVVEKVWGKKLVDLYRTQIWKPLGMKSSSYPDNAKIPDPHATPYLVDPGTGTSEEAPVVNLSALGAAGGMVSTLEDLHRWGTALGSGQLIGQTLQQAREGAAQPTDGGPDYDAYGLGIGELDGWWGHTGEGIGYNVSVFRRPEDGAVIVVLVNASQDVNAATEIFKELESQV